MIDQSYGTGRQFFIVDEDQLRQMIIDYSPVIHRDTQVMAEAIGDLVKLDREKAGLDKPAGTLELWPNKDKNAPAQPDLIGQGRIAGRLYRAAAWISQTDKIKISLLPKERK